MMAGEGTDDDGVPEGAGRGNEGLAHRLARLGGSSNDRGRTHAALVGEEAAGNTIAGCHHDGGSHKTATSGGGVEGGADDELDGRPHKVGIHAKDDEAAHHIEQSHEGHQDGTHAGDALDATQDDDSGEHADKDAYDPGGNAEGLVGQQGDAVGLDGTADAKGGQRREDGKEHGEPLHVQTTLEGIHRTTIPAAIAAFDTIFHSEQALGILGGHAEDASEPAPQHGTRTAQRHCRSHTHDIACANGGSEGGG